jgi:hypothetical protein
LTSGHCPADALFRLCRAVPAGDVDGDKTPKANNSVLPAGDVQDRGRRGACPLSWAAERRRKTKRARRARRWVLSALGASNAIIIQHRRAPRPRIRQLHYQCLLDSTGSGPKHSRSSLSRRHFSVGPAERPANIHGFRLSALHDLAARCICSNLRSPRVLGLRGPGTGGRALLRGGEASWLPPTRRPHAGSFLPDMGLPGWPARCGRAC